MLFGGKAEGGFIGVANAPTLVRDGAKTSACQLEDWSLFWRGAGPLLVPTSKVDVAFVIAF